MASRGDVRHYTQFIPAHILDDLCCRYINHLLPEEREDLIKVCCHIELAYWFYTDHYCPKGSKRCRMKQFATQIFQHIPHLKEHISRLDSILDSWQEYKKTIPSFGAILLDRNLTHVLLVKAYQSKPSWSFPKGKVCEDEKPWVCAVREVQEETGFDISKLINEDEYIMAIINSQIVGLYIIPDVPLETEFRPLTQHEIKACTWFPLAGLPLHKKDMTPKVEMGISPSAFFLVQPFVKQIRCWVAERNFKQNRMHWPENIPMRTTSNNRRWISQNEIQDYQNGYCSRSGAEASVYCNSSRKNWTNASQQLCTPQNTHTINFAPVLRLFLVPLIPLEEAPFNFVVLSRANLNFDPAIILICSFSITSG